MRNYASLYVSFFFFFSQWAVAACEGTNPDAGDNRIAAFYFFFYGEYNFPKLLEGNVIFLGTERHMRAIFGEFFTRQKKIKWISNVSFILCRFLTTSFTQPCNFSKVFNVELI